MHIFTFIITKFNGNVRFQTSVHCRNMRFMEILYPVNAFDCRLLSTRWTYSYLNQEFVQLPYIYFWCKNNKNMGLTNIYSAILIHLSTHKMRTMFGDIPRIPLKICTWFPCALFHCGQSISSEWTHMMYGPIFVRATWCDCPGAINTMRPRQNCRHFAEWKCTNFA